MDYVESIEVVKSISNGQDVIKALKSGVSIDLICSWRKLYDVESILINELKKLSDDGKFYKVCSSDFAVNSGRLIPCEPTLGTALTPSFERMSGDITTVILINGQKTYCNRRTILELIS